MTLVVVERAFDEPAAFAEVQALEDAVSWCLDQHRVRSLGSYFSVDRRHMVCLYEAPDAEAVQSTQRQGGLPVSHLWAATIFFGEPFFHAPKKEAVVVQRQYPSAVSPDAVPAMRDVGRDCMERHRVHLDVSFLSANGERQVCVFSAPDAEAVRAANKETSLPLLRAWKATIHTADQP